MRRQIPLLYGILLASFLGLHFASGKWYVFKLEEKRLSTENLTLESPGVRQQITQALIKQRGD